MSLNVLPNRIIKFSVKSDYIFFSFLSGDWKERWVQSQHKSDYGSFEWTSGKFYGDVDKDKGKT